MTPLTFCWNDMSTFFTARYPFIITLDVILVGGWVRNITSILRFAFVVCNFSLLLTTVFRGFKHIKHCFLVNSAFLLPFCATLAFACIQLDTRDSLANFALKSLSLFGCWQGGREVKNRDFYGDILFEWPLRTFTSKSDESNLILKFFLMERKSSKSSLSLLNKKHFRTFLV